MKQHITLEQWDEIGHKQKQKLWNAGFQKEWRMRIGQMIEFLGDDMDEMSNCKGDWHVYLEDEPLEPFDIVKDELCDALWEACKNKLNQL